MSTADGPFAASLIDASRRVWASNCAWRLGEPQPAPSSSAAGSNGGEWREHFDNLLQHLSAALAFDAPELFVQQVAWLRVLFESRGIELALLKSSLVAMRDELRGELPERAGDAAGEPIERGLAELDLAQPALEGGFAQGDPATAMARHYLVTALEGRREEAIDQVLRALERGMSVDEVLTGVLARAQTELGAMWQRSELSIVEEHLVSRTTEDALARIHVRLPHAPPNGLRVLLTSVDGDLHDLGLRVVATHFEMAGWNTTFLGASTPPAETALAAAEFEVHLVAAGAKLVTQLRAAAELVRLLRSDPRTQALPVIFGGRPFELAPNLWRALKADGCAKGGVEGVALATRLVARRA